MSDLPAVRRPTPPRAVTIPGHPNPRRVASARRSRLASLVLQGNSRALTHGVRAVIANEIDVATEVAVTFAAHPALDPIRDRRLVETWSIAAVQHARVQIALARDGMTPTLTAYDSRLSALCERLERAVFDREKARNAEMRTNRGIVDLTPYRPAL